MKHAPSQPLLRKLGWLAAALLLGVAASSSLRLQAYPPAPSHIIYGMLRDEFGTPISSGAEVILQTSSGLEVKVAVNPGIETSANYRLEVPMDSGLMAAPYMPTALQPTVPFRMLVRIGGTTYLPIEMVADFKQLGQPGRKTRLNLTLGEDSDGDGLPDAWERLINPDISKVKPGDDTDKDGLSNQLEYLAGTYAFDPENGFALSIVGFNQGAPLLEFLAVTARNYTLLGSTDLKTWKAVSFKVPAEGASASIKSAFQTDSVKKVQLEVAAPADAPTPTFFRLMLQ